MKSFAVLLLMFTTFSSPSFSQQEVPFRAEANGLLRPVSAASDPERSSPGGVYTFDYRIGKAGDETRELLDFRLFKNNSLLFTIDKLPGSDAEVSDNGFTVVYDHTNHFNRELTIHVFSPAGSFVFKMNYRNASSFTFSDAGNYLMVRNAVSTDLINLENGKVTAFPKALASSYREAAGVLLIAGESTLTKYRHGIKIFSIEHNAGLIRRAAISANGDYSAVISGDVLAVYNSGGEETGRYSIEHGSKFRDLKYSASDLFAGVHFRSQEKSDGNIKIFTEDGDYVRTLSGTSMNLPRRNKVLLPQKSRTGYDAVPWPFAPFDSARTVWNHYEQHMGLSDTSSYLHQGLDLIVPIAEPTYAVKPGIVKCVLTIGGASYWRLAVSDSQNGGFSDGWLYAHLIQNTIQVDIGDTVGQFDFLANIVAWTSSWAHIHFANIRDSGAVWLYNDGEWGINFNPLFAVTPLNDVQPPAILPVFPGKLFAFTKNETSDYLDHSSLSGVIDIIASTVDTICNSEWEQPAAEVYYEIKDSATGATVKPKTLAHILNHPYDFYDSGHYIPYAGVIYKRDLLLQPPSWMSESRSYYHNLTNSDGDSMITLQERELGFDTRLLSNGKYILKVTAYDPSGNSASDSMVITISNPSVAVDETYNESAELIFENYPNPFSGRTTFSYTVGARPGAFTELKIYTLTGKEAATLVSGYKDNGTHRVEFSTEKNKLSSGVYIAVLKSGVKEIIRKIILIK